MALSGPVFFDTSVLLGGLIEQRGPRDPEQRALTAVAAGKLPSPQTSWHCCLEFFSVATRLPEEYRVTPAEATLLVEEEILARFAVVDLPGAARRDLLRAAAADGIGGGRIYDAHIAESARAAGARAVVTGNRRHFVTLLRHGIVVLTPDELVREARLGTKER